MFNSQKINNDPEPYIGWSGKRYSEESHTYATLEDGPVGEEPRPEYDNNPNPILVAFREDLPHALVPFVTTQEAAKWWLHLPDYRDMEECFSPKHIDHARKVLEKLVNVYG